MNFEQTFASSRVDTIDNPELTMEQALGALREATIEDIDVSPDFEAAVLRRHRLAVSRRKFSHWVSGVGAALLAALALLTFLQLVAVPSTMAPSESSPVSAGR